MGSEGDLREKVCSPGEKYFITAIDTAVIKKKKKKKQTDFYLVL